MVRRLVVLIAALLMFAAGSLASAEAATVVYYSKTTGAYGWCAGYSYGEGETCAQKSCSQYGGTDCALATECDGGWTATAFAEQPHSGFGTSCGWNSAGGARLWAIVSCMLASNTFCHVDQTFDRGGNLRSEADNRTFDQIWFAQVLLDLSNNNAGTYDGEMGPKTRAAIRAFQKQIGVPQTGEVDDALIAQLRDGMGGAGALLDLMRNDPSYVGKVPDYTFSYSASPVPTTTLGEEIMLRSEADRRMALATMLNTANVACSRPARSVAVYAETKFADWHIDCAEGAHRLSVTGPGAWKVYDDGGGAADASPRNLPGANPVRRHRDDSLPATPGASGQNQ